TEIDDPIERPLRVLDRHRVAGRELDAVTQCEAPSLSVRRTRPFGRERRRKIDVLAGLHRDERVVSGRHRHWRGVLGKPRRIERDCVADIDAEDERVLPGLRENTIRQSNYECSASDAKQLQELPPINPAKPVRHALLLPGIAYGSGETRPDAGWNATFT